MDNLVLYFLIALLIIVFFLLYIYQQYFNLSDKLNTELKTINAIEEEAEAEEEAEEAEEEAEEAEEIEDEMDRILRKEERIIAKIDGSLMPGSASAVPGSASAVPGSASAVPGSASAVPDSASAAPDSTSAIPTSPLAGRGTYSLVISSADPSINNVPEIVLPFTNYAPSSGKHIENFEPSEPAPVTVLDAAPTVTFRESPEPPSISGLLNQDLTNFKDNLNKFFKTNDVTRMRKQGPSLVKPEPESIPQIKHLYGDGSYDDFDNVHVYKTN